MDWEFGISRCNFIELVKMFILCKILGKNLNEHLGQPHILHRMDK